MDTFEINNIKLTVKEDNEFIAKYGIPKGFPCAVITLPLLNGFDGHVSVTSGFFSLSEESQKTMLTHEAGHAACGHLLIDVPPDGLLINADIEAEADAWADSVLGDGAFDKFIKEHRLFLLEKGGDKLTPELIEKINVEFRVRTSNRLAWIAKNR